MSSEDLTGRNIKFHYEVCKKKKKKKCVYECVCELKEKYSEPKKLLKHFLTLFSVEFMLFVAKIIQD